MLVLILISAGAAVHAFMFGRWLIFNGNRSGAFVAYLIAATCVALPLYRYMTAP